MNLIPFKQDTLVEDDPASLKSRVPCAEEEIRIPGNVQPHGFLLGFDRELTAVILASGNAGSFLALPMKLILGSSMELLFEKELLASLQLLKGVVTAEGLIGYLGAFRVRDELCSVVTHCVGERRIVEFEKQDRLVGPEMMNAVITNFVATLSTLRTEQELCEVMAKQFQDLTGFHRVMLYRFDSEGHGTVLAEASDGTLPSYLDLRFPSSDIPPQARALYIANTVRIIPSANYAPVPLTGQAGEDAQKLDMSSCILRSVSPVHLEYMRNMGTMSSMSVSIICEGKLWGLISGHHAEPRSVPFLVRSACDMLTKMVASHLTAFRTSTALRTALQFQELQRKMFTQMAAENNYILALSQQMGSLMEITAAAGAVLAVDGHFDAIGVTPERDMLRRLIDWLDSRSEMEFYETNHLANELPWISRFSDVASGLLAIRFSDLGGRYVLWFRPEVVRTVRWAGEPAKSMDQAKFLHPRASFQTWKETLRDQSLPWTTSELESAREFRGALTTISLRRAEEEAALSEARFNKLTHVLPIKVFAATDEGELTYVNARWREEGFLDHGLWFEGVRLVPEDADKCAAAWKYALAHETELEEEVRLVAPKTGIECWNLIRLVPFRREGARRAGWIGASIDLSERKARETALRVTEKLTLTARMTSYLAHEINNPLAAITNTLFLLQQKLPKDHGTAADFATVENELTRISSTVQQTLRWGAENSGEKTWTTSGVLFEDVLKLYASKIRNRSVRISIEGDPTIQVYGIAGQIRQVIAHLVSNALDAVPVGGKVWMRAERLLSDVEILVGDAGSGMSQAQQSALFRPFNSTKGDYGNGLGLYISLEIAERHHGRFVVESVLGEGTIMRLRLPAMAQ
jgi:light-regulated signal transduction histidine kinase (bacteriophytochrome)